VLGWYNEFFRRNIMVDFAHSEADLSPYRLVVMPHLYLVSERAVQNIGHYVADGGSLLTTFFSGIVDGNDQVHLGGYPAPFRSMLGLRIEEFVPLMEGQQNSISANDQHEFPCDLWSEIIHAQDAEVLATFQQDYLAARPAVTRHLFGKGCAFYLGTQLERTGLTWLMDLLCARSGLRPVLGAPMSVEVTRRSDGMHTWLFLLNHSSEQAKIDLPGRGIELVSGAATKSSLCLVPKGVAVIQLDGER
jgi:beta-galactosidase